MSASRESIAVSLRLQELARGLDQEIQAVAGKRVAFTLLVFTDGMCNYISNASREDSARELRRLLSQLDAGVPDVAAHEKN